MSPSSAHGFYSNNSLNASPPSGYKAAELMGLHTSPPSSLSGSFIGGSQPQVGYSPSCVPQMFGSTSFSGMSPYNSHNTSLRYRVSYFETSTTYSERLHSNTFFSECVVEISVML